MPSTVLKLVSRLFAFSALMVLLGVVAPTNALALDMRAIVPSLNLTAFEMTYVSASPLPQLTAHPTPPSPLPAPVVLAHIVGSVYKTRKWINDIQHGASYTLCRTRPPFFRSRLASHMYHALFLARLELCPPGTSLIESLPRPPWSLPVRRPPLAIPMLPPLATPTTDERLPTRVQSPVDGHFPSPQPAHLLPRRPPPASEEESEPETAVEYRSTLVQELMHQAHLLRTWILEQDMERLYMVVLYSIVKLGVMSLSVYIGWFMDFKFLAPCWLSLRVLLSGEPEVFVRYTHFLIIRGYRASSPEAPFLRVKSVWKDTLTLPNRERLERRRRKDISQKVAEYQTRYEGQDDVAFKVYLVRSWEVYREYRMFNKFDKFEVPDKDNRGSKLFMGLVRPVQVVEPEAPVLPRPPRRTPPRALPDIHIPSPPDMSTPRPRERPQTYYWELEIAVGEL
ncbi:hypothetical protein RhiJN_01827 [Ceratobasidium sp. AG-Ba]|nr:hypothetical protein RhiJN_01827 [Ceratobasidium sp. AG-Ba]